MKKFLAASFNSYRTALWLSAITLCVAVYCDVTPDSSAEGNADKNASATQNERPAITGPCTMGPFISIAPMLLDVQGAFAVSNGADIFVGGGYSNSNFQTSDVFSRYDPDGHSWTRLTPLTTPVYGASAVFVPEPQ